MNSVQVLKKELAEAKAKVKALESAIIIVGGKSAGASSGSMPKARREKIAKAQRARWKRVRAEKKKAGKG